MLRRVDRASLTTKDLISLAIFRDADISPELREILRKLEKSSLHDFYLTGSFSKQSGIAPADLDFFCVSTNGVFDFLIGHGFRVERGLYAEKTFAKVLRYIPGNLPSHWSISHIDIQLVHPHLLDRKIYAQSLYEDLSPYLKDLCEGDNRRLWRLLMFRAKNALR